MEQWTLSGKIALVTGAGRGIGRAIALGLGQASAIVCCVGRTCSSIEATASEIQQAGGQSLAIAADVTDRRALQYLFHQVNQCIGPPDILVLNAGGPLERGPVEVSDPEQWRATLELNLVSPYLCVQAALPYMKEQGGNIITLGSGRGHRPKAGTSAYSCAKAGLWMLTRILAEELHPYRININELIPGPVLTEGFQASMAGADLKQAFSETEWFKQPTDVVPLALFLASQPWPGPTGQCFSLMRRDAL